MTAKRSKKPTRSFSVVLERDTDGWLVASVPELPGCHTQAKTQDQLFTRIKIAIELCLEVEGTKESGLREFIGVQRVVV